MLWNSNLYHAPLNGGNLDSISCNVCLLSPQMLADKQHRALLLQFLLFNIFEAEKAFESNSSSALYSASPYFYPYDWGTKIALLNKAHEHASLLKNSFGEDKEALSILGKAVKKIFSCFIRETRVSKKTFKSALKSFYLALEPFIKTCRNDENLIFFLLKNKTTIDRITDSNYLYHFFQNLYPQGIENIMKTLCDRYHERGFFSQISEFKSLFSEMIPAASSF